MKKLWVMFISLFGFGCVNKPETNQISNKSTLQKFSDYNKRFRFFFLISDNWIEAKFHNDKFYSFKDRHKIQLLNDYIISYRDGDMAYSSREFEYHPDEIEGLDSIPYKEISFKKERLETGNHLCEISFERSPILSDDSNYYETKIKNISAQKFTVLRFGGFRKSYNNIYILSTVTNDFFSELDFSNWYMDLDDDEEWIYPNQIVSDPINYGGVKNNWAYEIQVESGETFWISKLN